jgi:hypothetical protein
VPITIDPQIGWFGIDLSGGKFASDLFVAGLLPEMLEANPIVFPAPDRITKALGLHEQEKVDADGMSARSW